MAVQDINGNSSAGGDYLSLYGLTREPFIGEMLPAFFYPGATREQRLNLLLHLIPLGEILLITGTAGIGKTTLLEQLLAKGKESWRVCRLDGSAGLDSNQLLQQLVQVFSPEIAGQTDRAEMERLLISQLQLLRKNAQQAILLIDNAQHISESGLRTLSRFIVDDPDEEKLLGVVLFSEPEIEEKLNNPALQVLRGQIKHTFELPLLSEEETQQYLDHRIQAAGFQGASPFTAAVNKAIFGASKGLPVKINELAQAVIQNKRHVAPPPPVAVEEVARVDPTVKSKARRISLSMIWPFAVAAVLAGMLVFQDEFNALFDPPGEEAVVTAEIIELPAVEESMTQGVGSEMVEEVAERAVPVEQQATEPEVAVQEVVPKALTVDLLPMRVTKAEVIEPAVVEAAVTEAAKVTSPVAKLAMITPGKAASKKEPVEALSPAPKVDWVSAQPPQAYTLQIVAQQQEQKREAFVARFDLGSRVERFSTNKKGVRWYVAAIGVYDSRTAALEASRQLPEGVVPWVRSFASIQKELWQTELAREDVKRTESVVNKPLPSDRDSTQSLLTDQERWVMARSPDHYVLQLAAFEDKARTRDFIESHQLQDLGKLVRLINKGQLWYVAIYGDAENRLEALQLADDLESSKGVSRPWVRSFDSLQRAVEKIQQK